MKDVEHYDYDPEKGKEILESVGCTMGEDGFYYRNDEVLGFVISVGAGDQVCGYRTGSSTAAQERDRT